jgi:ATP phosphoribosyltransferase
MTMTGQTALLMLGLPKGSMEQATIELFARAGWKIGTSSRSYKPTIDDDELDGRFVRSQEMSRYVELGFFDVGLCGRDWIEENDSDVHEVCELVYSRASNRSSRYVLAVPEESPIQTVEDLEGKRVATEVLNITRRYLNDKGVNAEVEFSWGATEMKVPDLVDAIVDITETGSSLRANRLRIIDTIMTTTVRLIANKASWQVEAKRRKIENIALLLQSALQANDRVGLKLNCRKDKVDQLIQDLPALRNPTISRLADESWVALDTVLEERVVREIIPVLKAHGAEGIIEYPLNKVVY